MNYHDIKHDDMLNGDGLRVTVFLSGCNHCCKGCQNPETHALDSGILFDDNAKNELFDELRKDYVSGVTFSGGDPLHPANIEEVLTLIKEISIEFPTKTIWVYTGYEIEEVEKLKCGEDLLLNIDVLVAGRYIEELADINAHWVGSTNQKIWRRTGHNSYTHD